MCRYTHGGGSGKMLAGGRSCLHGNGNGIGEAGMRNRDQWNRVPVICISICDQTSVYLSEGFH